VVEMNLLEAKIIIRCKPPKKLEEIWKSFKGKYRYDYISKTCSNLAKLGLLIRRKFKSPINSKVVTYYTATEKAINDAVEFINLRFHAHEMQITTTSSIREYVK